MTRRSAPGVSALLLMYLTAFPATAGEPLPGDPVTATCRFEPADDEKNAVPERYRLPARTFDYNLTPRYQLKHSGVNVYDLTFPSPVKSGVPENDTVYAEYFVPTGASAAD